MTCEDAPCCGCCGTLAWSAESYSDTEDYYEDYYEDDDAFFGGPDEWDED